MKYCENKVSDLKIAYIGGGSRNWAWNLMSDLAKEKDISGSVYLYDIEHNAAKNNEIIGNGIEKSEQYPNNFKYIAVKNIEEALVNADFVVISILPGTFDEMYSDVHSPEKYGIYQPVGDSTGSGGCIRALRTLPMFEFFAKKVEKCCPDAWVINYTNPMTLCVAMLYRAFPKIKAFGCCHEVFGTQEFLKKICEKELHIDNLTRKDIKVNVVGVNHFTWLTQAHCQNIDLFPIYKEYCKRTLDEGIENAEETRDENWANSCFRTLNFVKMDLFLKYGAIAAAGDRHLVEFLPNNWYLKDPKTVEDWGFALTTVDWRKEEQKKRIKECEEYVLGKRRFEIKDTGEEGVAQIKALLGLGDMVTNVNIPNCGQIPNLPMGHIVETNASFTSDSLMPVMAGNIPDKIYGLITPIVACQNMILDAVENRDLKTAFNAFINDPQNYLDFEASKELFKTMINNTKEYLSMYDLSDMNRI